MLEADMDAVAAIKTRQPVRQYAALEMKNNSVFSTPTQANNLSFLEGHTTGSTMTQIETQENAGHASKFEKGQVYASFDSNVENINNIVNR